MFQKTKIPLGQLLLFLINTTYPYLNLARRSTPDHAVVCGILGIPGIHAVSIRENRAAVADIVVNILYNRSARIVCINMPGKNFKTLSIRLAG